eukprot:scaffold23232_cov131-Isochrysis_galbana.AAC.12
MAAHAGRRTLVTAGRRLVLPIQLWRAQLAWAYARGERHEREGRGRRARSNLRVEALEPKPCPQAVDAAVAACLEVVIQGVHGLHIAQLGHICTQEGGGVTRCGHMDRQSQPELKIAQDAPERRTTVSDGAFDFGAYSIDATLDQMSASAAGRVRALESTSVYGRGSLPGGVHSCIHLQNLAASSLSDSDMSARRGVCLSLHGVGLPNNVDAVTGAYPAKKRARSTRGLCIRTRRCSRARRPVRCGTSDFVVIIS